MSRHSSSRNGSVSRRRAKTSPPKKSSRSSRSDNPPTTSTVPTRSHRFSPEQRQRAMQLIVDGLERSKVANTIGCTTESLRRWHIAARTTGTLPAPSKSNGSSARLTLDEAVAVAQEHRGAAAQQVVGPPSAPKDPGSGLGEHETKAILDYKQEEAPVDGAGADSCPAQALHGWRLSVRAIARVLRKAGYLTVHRKGRPVGDELSLAIGPSSRGTGARVRPGRRVTPIDCCRVAQIRPAGPS